MGDERDELKERIRRGFDSTPPPAPSAIKDSSEGDEPYLLEDEFREVPDWRGLDPSFLDRSPGGFGTALCFFSPEAFRYYLPGTCWPTSMGCCGRPNRLSTCGMVWTMSFEAAR